MKRDKGKSQSQDKLNADKEDENWVKMFSLLQQKYKRKTWWKIELR